jgi:hypothetical protein
MVFLLTGSGARTAESYNGSSSKAPRLHIEWDFCTLSERIYVDLDAPGPYLGPDWQYAIPDLVGSLAVASECSGAREIWVKAGTYNPGSFLSRAHTFQIQGELKLFGGFEGTELDTSERNVSLNQTILSGDIGIEGDSSDNVFHVVTVLPSSDTVYLNGLMIRGGNANGTTSTDKKGGGIYTTGNVILENININQCLASLSGPALYASGEGSTIYIEINNCVFQSNIPVYNFPLMLESDVELFMSGINHILR